MAGNRNKPTLQNRTQDVVTSLPLGMEAEKQLKELQKRLAENQAALNKASKEYNKKYAESPVFRKAKHYEKELTVDFNYPSKTIRQIDSILNTPYYINDLPYTLNKNHKNTSYTFSAPSAKRRGQPAMLRHLRQFLVKRKEMFKNQYELNQKKLDGHKTRLILNSNEIEKKLETKSLLKKNPNFNKASSNFDSVFSGLMGKDPTFRRIYERNNGKLDVSMARKHKQLFLSIVGSQTDNFKDDLVLGKDFQDNPAENKAKFPFIYREWLKYNNVDTLSIESQRRNAEAQAKEAGLKSALGLEAKISSLVAGLNQSVKNSKDVPDILSFEDPVKKGVQNKEYYDSLKGRLGKLDTALRLAADQLNDDPKTKSFAEKLTAFRKDQLPPLKKVAEQMRKLKHYEEKKAKIDESFTRKKIKEGGYQQVVLELALKRFQKAIKIVDTPIGGGGDFRRLKHPGVRNLLIAMVYREGVARDIKGKYIKNTASEYQWMFSKLATSPYFNRSVKDKFLDPEQRDFIIIARYANLAMANRDYMKSEVVPVVSTLHQRLASNIKKRDAAGVSPAEKKKAEAAIKQDLKEMRRYHPENKKLTEKEALNLEAETKQRLRRWVKFAQEAEQIMKNPDRKKVRAFINKVESDTFFKLDSKRNKSIVKGFTAYMNKVDTTYSSLDLDEKSSGKLLESNGINPEGLFDAYIKYIASNPNLNVKQWDHLMRTKEGTKKLTDMFRVILPDSMVGNGKKSFIEVFKDIHGKKLLSTRPELRDSHAKALSIYKLIQFEIQRRETVRATTKGSEEKVKDILGGMTVGDKVEQFGRGVIDMFIGPGQPIVNRAAAAVMLIAFWKLAKKAYKGEGKSGKALRLLFIGAAAEMTAKKLYGEGLLDKLKFAGLAKALSGTYESVLLERAKVKFDREKFQGESITDAEHASALVELRTAPFHKVMEWYDATDSGGNPLHTKKLKLPGRMQAYNIVPGRITGNKEKRAAFILKKTIENFFHYVGQKDVNGDETDGKNALREIWVNAIKNPKYSLDHAKFTGRNLPPFLIDNLRRNPRSITWAMVMQAEIRPRDVEKATGKEPFEAAKALLLEKGHAIARWGRRDLLPGVKSRYKELAEYIKTDMGPSALAFATKMGEAGATKIKKVGRDVELWYKGNKLTIRKIGRQSWELVGEVVKLPGAILIGAHQLAVPFVTTKLRQFREILRSDKLVTIPHNRDLGPEDVVGKRFAIGLNSGHIDATKLMSLSEKQNPHKRYFGIYQVPFYKAMQNPESGGYYYKSENPLQDGPDNIGYFVSQTTPEQSGVKMTDSTSNRFNAMQEKGYKQAVAFYINKGLSISAIKKYMYPVHMVSKNASQNSRAPQKLYIFWRMPLKNSAEYQLKELDRWPDYWDPNKIKDRLPFEIDPKKSTLENLKQAFGNQSPALRKGFGYVSVAVGQYLRFVRGTLETGGKAIKGITGLAVKDPKKLSFFDALTRSDEKTDQLLDEWTGGAANPSLASSKFYKESQNAKIYKRMQDRAREENKSIDYTTDPIDNKPPKWKGVRKVYTNGEVTKGNKAVKRLNE